MAELTKLGRYQMRRVLGRGAMGVVYEGLDPSLNRRVAVKTILRNAAIDEETARGYSALFAREAQAAGRLNHTNIVQVHDFAEEGDVAYLVMEYIEGRELRACFEAKETFAPAETVRIMGELLDALHFAHEAGVIHRDVKPANVMLDAQRRVKLADFGVARIQDSERSAAGTMVGTPAFMSPEQVSGGKIDRRTDVFSAGVILYQLLTGEQPFKGEGAWTVAKKIMEDDPPPPSAVATNISPLYDAIVDKALAKKPNERFASAKEFAVALRATLGGAAPAVATMAPKPKAKPEARASEAEVEFWRSIQNSNDADEIEFYLEQFPEGTYSQLARHKIAKLRQSQDAQSTVRIPAEEKRLADEEEALRRQAEERLRQEAEAKARREAEEKALREALEKTKRDAAEKAKREAEAKAKAKRESEEKIRQAQALAKLRQQEEAAVRAAAVVDENATVAIGSGRPAAPPPAERKISYVIPAVAAAAVIAAGIVAVLLLARPKAPEPVAQVVAPAPIATPAPPPKTEISAAEIEKIRKETEERIRREYADKSAAEQAVAAKAAAEKTVQEKNLALRAATEKAIAEKAAAEKAAVEKAAVEKALAAKSAAERSAAEHAAVEKVASEKAAAEKVAADKLAAEKAAAGKAAAAAKPGWPGVGDRWVYEAREANYPDRKYQVVVDVQSVNPSGIRDAFRSPGGAIELTHQAGGLFVGVAPGIASFAPYLRAFQELRGGERWPNVEFRSLWQCSNSNMSCVASARVAGKERVTVRGGSYDAWKVVVELQMRDGRGFGSGEFIYWYAEEAKRFVKYQSRVTFATGISVLPWTTPDIDMELLSYTPAGTK